MVKNEMIERAVRALVQCVPISDGSHTQRFSTPEEIMDGYRAKVRAVLEVLLEPTDEMMEAAADEFTFHSSHWGPETTPETIQKAVFRRAIDAALSPEEA